MAPVEPQGGEKYDALGTRFAERLSCACASMANHSLDQDPDIDHRRKHAGRSRRRSHRCPADARARLPTRRNSPRSRQGRHARRPSSMTCRRRPSWKVDRYSQHLACDKCGRSFEPLNPHHLLVQQPARLVPDLRRPRRSTSGAESRLPCSAIPRPLSRRRGARLRGPTLTVETSRLRCLTAFAARTEQFSARQSPTRTASGTPPSSVVLHGNRRTSGSACTPPKRSRAARHRLSGSSTRASTRPSTKQPASVTSLRQQPARSTYVSEVAVQPPAAARRLRDDAAACRFHDLHHRPALRPAVAG